MVNEDTSADELDSDLRPVVEALLRSRPDLVEPNKLRRFEEILGRRVAALKSAGDNVLQDAASTDRAPTKLRPDEKFMWFVLDLGGGLLPAVLIAAFFPWLPLWILPVIVIVGFIASRYLITFDRPGR